MADIPNRSELEAKYARLLAKLLRAYGGRLLEKLGDPPRLENLPPEFWDEEARELRAALAPFGERVYLDAALQLVETIPIGTDWALINQAAVDWARKYTFELVTGITTTNRNLLQTAIGAYYEQGLTIGALQERIIGAFGPVRAEMIAVTEVTRAAFEGEASVVAELQKQGVSMDAYWQTNADEIVRKCPICGPMQGEKAAYVSDGRPRWIHPVDGYELTIPGHPRCRCWVNHRFRK